MCFIPSVFICLFRTATTYSLYHFFEIIQSFCQIFRCIAVKAAVSAYYIHEKIHPAIDCQRSQGRLPTTWLQRIISRTQLTHSEALTAAQPREWATAAEAVLLLLLLMMMMRMMITLIAVTDTTYNDELVCVIFQWSELVYWSDIGRRLVDMVTRTSATCTISRWSPFTRTSCTNAA